MLTLKNVYKKEKGHESLEDLSLGILSKRGGKSFIMEIHKESDEYQVYVFKNLKYISRLIKNNPDLHPSMIEDALFEGAKITQRIEDKETLYRFAYQKNEVNLLSNTPVERIDGVNYFGVIKDFLMGEEKYKIIAY